MKNYIFCIKCELRLICAVCGRSIVDGCFDYLGFVESSFEESRVYETDDEEGW
jgi:hypothetical protein